MEAMGLEPMTSRVWGERSSRLSYASIGIIIAHFQKKEREKYLKYEMQNAFPWYEKSPEISELFKCRWPDSNRHGC